MASAHEILVVTLNPALDLSIGLPALTLGAVNRTQSSQLAAAGKGLNVARVLAALGHRVTLSGLLGGDNDAPFVAACAQAGIEDASLRLPGETRINAKIAEDDGRVTDINGPGLHVSSEALEALHQRLSAHCRERAPGAVVLTGSLPPGVTAADFAALVAMLKATGVAVWVDTSGPALEAALAVPPSAVKPNEHELAAWAGATLDTREAQCEAARRLHRAGVEEALLSLGGEGLIWVSRRGEWLAEPPRVTVVNTVGAGDTLVAGMLHGILDGQPPAQVLRFATALAADAVRHVGVGRPEAADFSELLQKTRVQRLDETTHAGESA
ncbi:1-phosphofructokinase [Salinicola endophyticus]|uniref:Phosphofructokinase n=1 Tax=Salinicola endophyticus TaxID=1949083 RepID=A0ABY8FPJ5_9GAMM|nr:1-phosphofructokinase [Salinicola endophyticus]WFF41799.1 1-phosphofructokinase [Salinicola endophyticus]